MDGWMDGWEDGWVEGWVDGWKGEAIIDFDNESRSESPTIFLNHVILNITAFGRQWESVWDSTSLRSR